MTAPSPTSRPIPTIFASMYAQTIYKLLSNAFFACVLDNGLKLTAFLNSRYVSTPTLFDTSVTNFLCQNYFSDWLSSYHEFYQNTRNEYLVLKFMILYTKKQMIFIFFHKNHLFLLYDSRYFKT